MVEPNYYDKNGLSPLKAFEQGLLSNEELIGFCKGNIIKYTIRAGDKGESLEDILKAMDYLQYLYKALEVNKNEFKQNYGNVDSILSSSEKELNLKLEEFKKRCRDEE